MRTVVKSLPILTLLVTLFTIATPAQAQLDRPVCSNSGMPLPRFVSLAEDESWLRDGPGIEYDRTHIYPRRAVPLEIISERGEWREVRDPVGDTGWIHESALSGERLVVVQKRKVSLLEDPLRSAIVVRAAPGVIGSWHGCDGDHCRISITDCVGKRFSGWVQRRDLWGIHDWDPQNPCLQPGRIQ